MIYYYSPSTLSLLCLSSLGFLFDFTMLINELPDECLLTIFDHLNVLDDLINCFKVCVKWSYLIMERTKRVKYLFGDPVDWFDSVYYQDEKPIDGAVLKTLFGNLKLVEYSYPLTIKAKLEDIGDLIKTQTCLQGLIHDGTFYAEPIAKFCVKPVMVSVSHIEPSLAQYGSSVKQLIFGNGTLDFFALYAHHFPNLERLNISNNEVNIENIGSPDEYYDGPVMEKLQIVELGLTSYNGFDTYYGFQFMDSCPNLQSAYIIVDSNCFYIDETVKHKSLQDLVLYFFYIKHINWDELQRLFMKYPNLKNLALRGNEIIKDENIEQLVRILPNLVLFDARGCSGVTQRAADYVHDYCKRYGKSIKFYFDDCQHEIESDRSQLSANDEKISRGFDFMKNCFFRSFYSLPVFLVPIDY